MTPSPLTHDCPRTNRLSLALDRQRPHSRQAANFARPRTANVASQGRASPSVAVLAGKTIAQTTSIQTHQASRRDQIPIVLAAPPLHHPPRFRALALFGRRPHQRVDSSIMPATENLHKNRHRLSFNHLGDRKSLRPTVHWPTLIMLTTVVTSSKALL